MCLQAGGEDDPTRTTRRRTRAAYNPLWEGIHPDTNAKLYITVRQDHHELMVMYEGGKMILSHRIDKCGVHY